MTKSYRIRTAVNSTQEVDQTIRVNIDQDFDFLEILSLKLTQNDVYRRFCSDYGVIVGRVVANGGFGIPNARVSVFVPLDSIDASDPVISTLYPYTSPQDKNEDGYRYNLLPYEPSYEGHIPTGTFPSREDVLNRKEVLEIYEKYYKYTVRTNDSGDYMIVGVPLGNQQVVVDVDLSDIGCFSLRPTDLIRINRGVKSQFDGNQFKSSEDLASLPQIVNINRTINVSPFWGLGEECDVGITRVDFDLRDLNIDIQPTATFMGSIYSSADDVYLSNKCKPSSEQGDLCGLITGPGKLLAIRQTVELDDEGLPILEQYTLPEGGKVIDSDGAFVVDVPMNLDYLITNEYGELVISNNPAVGIPSKGKYRFKIKYADTEKDIASIPSPFNLINQNLFNLSTFSPKGSLERANFLIPNIKEYGWTSSISDPSFFEPNPLNQPTYTLNFGDVVQDETQIISIPPLTTVVISSIGEYEGIELFINNVKTKSKWLEFPNGGILTIKIKKKSKTEVNNGVTTLSYIPVTVVFNRYNYNYILFQKSYSFSLDWSDYANIQDALDCNDIFYEFTYNKVYTTAQLIDEFRNSDTFFARGNFLSIKEVLDRSCTATVNRPPINDGVRNFDIIYFVTAIFLFLFSILGPILIISYSLVKYLWNNFAVYIIGLFIAYFSYLASQEIIAGVAAITGSVLSFGATALLAAPFFAKAVLYITGAVTLGLLARTLSRFRFPSFSLPMITYPDCSACDCGDNDFGTEAITGDANTSYLADINLPGLYTFDNNAGDNILQLKKNLGWGQVVAGNEGNDTTEYARVPWYYQDDKNNYQSWNQIPFPERINLYNTKGHYFNTTPAGGTNRIKVFPNYTGNTPTSFYEDMPYVFLADAGTQGLFATGQLLSFINPNLSKDINVNITGDTKNQLNTTSVTGITNTTKEITINYADPNNPNTNKSVTVNITNSSTGEGSYIFAADLEYYQVVTALTVNNLISTFNTQDSLGNRQPNPDFYSSFYRRILSGETSMVWNLTDENNDEQNGATYYESGAQRYGLKSFENYDSLVVVILMRGVDPYTDRQKTKIDVSLPFGLKENSIVVESNYKLNIPIQSNLNLPRHNELTTNDTLSFGTRIFYPSYIFTPSTSVDNTLYTFSAYTTNNHLYCSSFDISTDTCDYGFRTSPSGNDYYALQNVPSLSGCFGGRNTLVGSFGSPPNRTEGEVGDGINNIDAYYVGEYIGGAGIMFRSEDNGYLYKRAVYDVTGDAKVSISDNTKIIMRSERLPRSDVFDNNFVFAQNKTFSVYTVSDGGLGTQIQANATQSLDYSTGQGADFEQTYGTGTTSVMSSFSCDNIVPLSAYQPQNDGTQLTTKPKNDPAYYKDGDENYPKVKNGCYVLCSKDLQIADDIALFAEWKARFNLGFAVCRNVFGLTFTNQWINGSLYMPGFQNDIQYPPGNNDLGIGGTEITNPVYNFCKKKLVFRIENNSFFYRSSPYNQNVGFVGMKSGGVSFNEIGNKYFLGTPTTIVDLGPKDNIIKNVCAKPEFQGYYLNRLKGSTYNTPGDLLQLFVVSRLTNATFLNNLFSEVPGSTSSIGQFFSREGEKIDGDFAQLISINSELGVTPFSPQVYSSESLFFGISKEPMMGVFFTADTISRDFVSPGRTTYIDTTKKFGYNTFGRKTQEVPMYQWAWVNGEGKPNIFGSQNNTWYTEQSTNGVFYSIGYQNIDRLNDDTYFPSQITRPTNQRPGYIYNSKPLFDGSNNITGFTYDPFIDNSFAIPSFNQIDVEQDLKRGFIVGAPYHFYFGIRKGKTAFDKFVANNLIE